MMVCSLIDVVAPNSLALRAAGSDHYFAEDENIHLKAIAMVKTIPVIVGRRELG